MLRLHPTVIRLTPSEVHDCVQRPTSYGQLHRTGNRGIRTSTPRWLRRQFHYPSTDSLDRTRPSRQNTIVTASEPVDFDVSIVNDTCAEPRDDEKSQVGDEIAAKERAPSTEVSIDLGVTQSLERLASPLRLAYAARTSLILTRQSSKQRHHVRHVIDEGQSEPSRAPRRDWARQGEHLVVGTEDDAAGEAALGDVIRTTQRLNVYDDSIIATIQPQTPMNLPEARHQSQLRGFYTAPGGMLLSQRARPSATTQRRHRAGLEPPVGLDSPGVQGLYGGIENTDELALYDTGRRSIRR